MGFSLSRWGCSLQFPIQIVKSVTFSCIMGILGFFFLCLKRQINREICRMKLQWTDTRCGLSEHFLFLLSLLKWKVLHCFCLRVEKHLWACSRWGCHHMLFVLGGIMRLYRRLFHVCLLTAVQKYIVFFLSCVEDLCLHSDLFN